MSLAPELDDTKRVRPFLKWAGGKWAIAPQIAKLLPRDTHERVYREPFLGGGAMFFYLLPRRAYLSDTLLDLVTTYRVVRRQVGPLIERLEALHAAHTTEQFYEVRERFNHEREASALDRAAWLIYINKTCYNGLFRTNRSGLFNVPVGRFASPRIVDPIRLRLAAKALTGATIAHASFDHLLDAAEEGDVVYLDPPYVPLTKTASFAAYADGGFGADDQERLADVFRRLDERGCLLALSNSDMPVVRKLYRGFDIRRIEAPRAISAKTSTRGATTEVLVRNLARYPR
jgi:DNA adenine methylase